MMKDRNDAGGQGLPAGPALEMPTPRRTTTRLLRVWIVGLLVFGVGPAVTYGMLTWLMNETQWGWTYLMYCTLTPVIGGLGVVALPWWRYRPIRRALKAWAAGAAVVPEECGRVYLRALQLPWSVAVGAFVSATAGYVIGTVIVYWQANKPVIEIIKTLPAIPLVGGMMASYCYFGTGRALHAVLAWCSARLPRRPAIPFVSMETKFLTVTCVLAIAVLCLLLPAAYRLGQVVTELHLEDRGLTRLQAAIRRVTPFQQELGYRLGILQEAALGLGYVFAVDDAGRVVTPHPRRAKHVSEEGFYQLSEQLARGEEGTWVDRVGEHRVVAFARIAEPPWTFFSVAYPRDFAEPLRHFVVLSWVVVLEVMIVVAVFGRYYTRSITIPLAELTRAAERMAEGSSSDRRVPIMTNDELSELGQSFNRMVEEVQASRTELEQYARRMEASTRELAALNQEMEDLLHVVSHDLRAPLINVQGFSKRLEPIVEQAVKTLQSLAAQSREDGLRTQMETIRGNLQTRFAESLQFISKGVEKMDSLLSSLLAISRAGRKADPVVPNNLNDILEDVLATFDHQLKERAITVIRHPLPTAIPCRRNELNQVFSNLVSNAMHYMGPSGDRFIEIGMTDHPERVECYVRDTGVGIASEDRERVFQMFTRLKTVDVPGEGVGLAYVRKILRGHGGRIWVTSARGQGSTFSFTLPKREAPVAEAVG